MKRNFLWVTIFLVFFSSNSHSQEAGQKCIVPELGMDVLDNELLFRNHIRGDVPSYYNMGDPADNLQHVFFKNYAGLKCEIFSHNQKFVFGSGIRYTRMHALLGKDPYSGSSAKFFYLLYSQTDLTTEYLKVRQIEQKSDYLGIPLEIRYFAFSLSASEDSVTIKTGGNWWWISDVSIDSTWLTGLQLLKNLNDS